MATTNLEAIETLALKVTLSDPPMRETTQVQMWTDVARELARRLDTIAGIGAKSSFGDPTLISGMHATFPIK